MGRVTQVRLVNSPGVGPLSGGAASPSGAAFDRRQQRLHAIAAGTAEEINLFDRREALPIARQLVRRAGGSFVLPRAAGALQAL